MLCHIIFLTVVLLNHVSGISSLFFEIFSSFGGAMLIPSHFLCPYTVMSAHVIALSSLSWRQTAVPALWGVNWTCFQSPRVTSMWRVECSPPFSPHCYIISFVCSFSSPLTIILSVPFQCILFFNVLVFLSAVLHISYLWLWS